MIYDYLVEINSSITSFMTNPYISIQNPRCVKPPNTSDTQTDKSGHLTSD